MKRYALLCMVAFSATTAAAEELPEPPLPPDQMQLQMSQIAPVPDQDVRGPETPLSERPSVNVKLYRAQTYDPSLGFTPGSRYQTTEDRKPIQTPGLSLSVPLQ